MYLMVYAVLMRNIMDALFSLY